MSVGNPSKESQHHPYPTPSRRGRKSPASPPHTQTRKSSSLPPPRLASILAPFPPSSTDGKPDQPVTLLMPPVLSFTAATPEASPISPILRTRDASEAFLPTGVLRTPSAPASVLRRGSATPPPLLQRSESSVSAKGKGKRKADEAGVGGSTPPKEKAEQRATFAADPRPHRASNNSSSHAPSSYHRKRARLSTTPESRPASRAESSSNVNAGNTGSWSSRGSTKQKMNRPPSTSTSNHHSSNRNHPQREPSRRSLSQASIPISALISPHAPSVGRASGFHMRDPRKPAPIQSTPWGLSLPDSGDDLGGRWSWRGWVERGGSPVHAWMFFIGFMLFPVWWLAASVIGIPRTRRIGSGEEKGEVVLDDPQVEFDAKSWRFRCRVMAVVSLFTYVPFIVLIAIFVPR